MNKTTPPPIYRMMRCFCTCPIIPTTRTNSRIMMTFLRSRVIPPMIARRRCCSHHQATLTSTTTATDTGPSQDKFSPESVIQWLITNTNNNTRSSFPLPPPPNIRMSFTTPTSSASPPSLTLTIHHNEDPKTKPEPYHLSPTTSIRAATTLLTPLLTPPTKPNLLRQPTITPPSPLTIEFSSPNIAKPLHMGHLRSTITGSFIRNISEFAGHACTSTCFLGDWGRQFGVLHAGVIQEMESTSATPPHQFTDFIQSLSLHQLLTIYVKASEKVETDSQFRDKAKNCSAELELAVKTSDDKATPPNGKELWTHTRTITLDHLKSCYSKLSIHFDNFESESDFSKTSVHTTEALNLLQTHGLVKTYPDGSVRVKCPQPPKRSKKKSDIPPPPDNQEEEEEDNNYRIVIKRDGSSVYLLRDIACALRRFNTATHPHKFVYVVDSSQSAHFTNLFSVLKDLGLNVTNSTNPPSPPFQTRFTHIPFGRVSGMSTRTGTMTLLSDVITQGTDLMHESRRLSKNARNIEDRTISEQLAISALVLNYLQARRTKDMAFDWNVALRTNGNTGVAVQYTIARLRSLVERVGNKTEPIPDPEMIHTHVSVLFRSGNRDLIHVLTAMINFEDTFWRAYTSLEPCILVTYVYHLCDKVSRALSTTKLITEQDEQFKTASLWLFDSCRTVITTSLRIVGVQPVDKGF